MGIREKKVSVIICAYSLDRFNDVLEAVASALGQTIPPHQAIVSVDNNRELLERLRTEIPATVTLVFNDGVKGLSETRNAGLRAASGDIIAFMDDDAVAEQDWLENLVRPFDVENVAAAGGRIVPQWLDGGRPGWFPEELDWIVGCTYAGLPHSGNQVRNLIGCNMAFRAEVFDSVGLFNTAVGRTGKTRGSGEDSEFCLRITRKLPGVLIVYEPRAIVHHKVPSWRVTPGYLLRRSYDEGFHKSTVKKLHSGSPGEPLSTENSYLRYLFVTAISRRLKTFYRRESFLQMDAIFSCIAATGAGFLKGQLAGTEHNNEEGTHE